MRACGNALVPAPKEEIVSAGAEGGTTAADWVAGGGEAIILAFKRAASCNCRSVASVAAPRTEYASVQAAVALAGGVGGV